METCCKHSNHVTLLPYFHGNHFLQQMHKELSQNNPNSEQCQLLQSLMLKEIFSRPGPVFSSEYNEDEWTERL